MVLAAVEVVHALAAVLFVMSAGRPSDEFKDKLARMGEVLGPSATREEWFANAQTH